MAKKPTVGAAFMEETSYSRSKPMEGPTSGRQPSAHKQYRRVAARIELPPPERSGGSALWTVLSQRRSQRDFSREALNLGELSQLLWAVSGLTGERGDFLLRTTASAGALYPNETYVFLNRVEDCPPGIAHYQVRDHALEPFREGDFSHDLVAACLGQGFCQSAGVVLCWASVIARGTWKYADRAYRYSFLDAGHLGAHLQLAATALGLGSVNVGAFFDDQVNALLGLDGKTEFAVYLAAVGKV